MQIIIQRKKGAGKTKIYNDKYMNKENGKQESLKNSFE